MKNLFKLIIAVVVCELAGVAGALFTTPAIKSGWYETLMKPTLNPPAWVFGPVWTTLFVLMGVAVWLVYLKLSDINPSVSRRRIKVALVVFLIQLLLNACWSIIFFGSPTLVIGSLNHLGLAFFELLLLAVAILLTIFLFSKISRPAAWLLVPYILWVSFAGYLNFSIWQLNPAVGDGPAIVVSNDNLRIFSPLPDTEILSPLVVTGEARGNWFFEASFPVILTNWDGLIIAQGIAQAEGDWMTTDYIPFTVTLNFTKPDYGTTGSLILKKDNPSGLPQFDDALEITVKFK